MIVFDNVSKVYANGKIALEDISIKIEEGEFVFLVGPSGSGKTTLLRLLIKDLNPDRGNILIDEVNLSTLKKKQTPFLRRKIGFIFQDFKLIWDRTVEENIAVSLQIQNTPKEDVRSRIKEVISLVDLEGREKYFPQQLSLGEQQRASIGRAVLGGASIILADEPTGNLDPKTSWEILKLILDINKSGSTVIMATHNVDIVNSMKKRVITLKNGRVTSDRKKASYS